MTKLGILAFAVVTAAAIVGRGRTPGKLSGSGCRDMCGTCQGSVPVEVSAWTILAIGLEDALELRIRITRHIAIRRDFGIPDLYLPTA